MSRVLDIVSTRIDEQDDKIRLFMMIDNDVRSDIVRNNFE